MNFLSKALIFILVGWMAIASWWYVCKVKGQCTTSTEKVSKQNDLIISLEGMEDMVFSVSTSKDGAINFQNKTAGQSIGAAGNYLFDNPDKNIAISSHNENIVESLLSSLMIIGVPEDRITYAVTSSKNKPTSIKSINNPSYIEVNSPTEESANQTEVETAKKDIAKTKSEVTTPIKVTPPKTTEPKVWIPCPDVDVSSSYPTIEYVLFSSTSYKVSCTSALKTYAEAAAKYIAENGGKVTVTGHTDDDKKQLNNLSLGLKRASEVKKHLIRYGIPPNKIESYSKGDTQPFGSNQTESGKKLNNRVTIELY